MLVLSRKPGEKIMIGDDIEIVVLEIERGKVRLGIAAPRSTPIVRDDAKVRDCPVEQLYRVEGGEG